MKKIIILTAEFVSKELKQVIGEIPPVLLPYDGKIILDGIYEANKNNYEIDVITYEGYEKIFEYVNINKLAINLEKLKELKSLKDSVLASKFDGFDNLIIIFGDTVIKEWNLDKYNGDIISYTIVNNPIEWTTFEISNQKLKIYDKVKRDFQENYKSFAGIFSFTDVKLLKKSLKTANSFYEAIQNYVESKEVEFVEEKDWVDLGHIEEYLKNQNHIVETRYFNEISINREKGTLIKKSIEIEKFSNEIKWYLKMPKELEYLIPRIFDYSLNYDNMFIEMEYYSYPTLHNLFIYGNQSIYKWNKILDLLIKTNKKLSTYQLDLDRKEVDSALEKIYINKTLDRLNELKKEEIFLDLFEKNIIINGNNYPSLSEIMEDLPEMVRKVLLNIDKLSLIHGDYFFANILYDSNTDFVRLIDPRGDFGGYGIYGDYRYDLAKLSHSVNGKYDFIINDKFSVNKIKNNIKYEIFNESIHDEIKELFYSKLGNNIVEIKLIESLLFLSMVPLHSDYPERQKVMISYGIELFSEIKLEVKGV